MLFSQQTIDAADINFAVRLAKAGDKKEEIENALRSVGDEDVRTAIKWLYAFCPLSDMANYDFSLFESFARHGVFLRRNSPFCKDVAEDVFLNFVMHPRMGGEEICDCRKYFFDMLSARIKGMSMRDAIIELNYFNAENVRYAMTDYRTLSALSTFNAAYGRCGEEAVFAVNVFRAMGIPARQVYTPRWAHCDDNHAWVEVFCDGKWRFLGACEPEEVLDKGWFNNAAGRALITLATCFGPTTSEVVGRLGFANLINTINTYADTKRLTVCVKDENGPVAGARVSFGILNHSHVFYAVSIITKAEGVASVECGYGTMIVKVSKGDVFDEFILAPEQTHADIVLKPRSPRFDEWKDFRASAPRDGRGKGAKPTAEQKEICRVKTAAANEKRARKVDAMFDEKLADKIAGDSAVLRQFLKDSAGNFKEIADFLQNGKFGLEQKTELLSTLPQKDLLDVKAEVLEEALEFSGIYADKYDKDIYYKYIACPRVAYEVLTKCRKFIGEYFTEEQKCVFRGDPRKIPEYVRDTLVYDASVEYGNIITWPVAALRTHSGHKMSARVLFVSICRTLGIPARLNPISGIAEYYYDGAFVAVETTSEESGDCVITLVKDEDESYAYMTDFGIAALTDGNYVNLELSDEKWADNTMRIPVKSGEYRIITDNRLPCGDILASTYSFRISSGEEKRIKMHKQPFGQGDMLLSYDVDDFVLTADDGNMKSCSAVTDGGAILMWLETGAEPTVHLLNEMLANRKEFEKLKIRFVLRDKSMFYDAKLGETLAAFKDAKVYFDTKNEGEGLSRRLFLDPEKLPLVAVFDRRLHVVYAYCGYNFGGGDMIIKLTRELK